ncbi:hypothetical protein MUP35_00405 [Patescibacteria group bacterium]|nr:hypothetical protein [Patescibacteria group bacterium]
MENNKEIFIKNELITKESLQYYLGEFSKKREEKGSSEIILPYLCFLREQAEILKEPTLVLQFYQEEFLCDQHMVMEEKAKRFKANPIRAAKGMLMMNKTAKNMEKFMNGNEERIDPVVKNRVFRFLGRQADYQGKYSKSENYYRKGLAYFDSLTNLKEKSNRLEFMGFLSYSLIKQGKEEGIDLAKQTLKDFDESPEGKLLKENDYYTWAVWKSGVEIRTAKHLGKTKNIKYGQLAKDFFNDAEKILRMPDGNTEIFRLRLDELNVVNKLFTKQNAK